MVVLLADDDADDREMTAEAFRETHAPSELRCVQNGEELLDYLRHKGSYAAPGAAPRPSLILLDLNMPRKDGREALAELKTDPSLRAIPVVVLTTTKGEPDLSEAYRLGANSFITKPSSYDELLEAVKTLARYWLEVVALPGGAP